MRLYTSRYDVHTFPYDRALQIWRSKCERRGLGNTSNQSASGTTGATGSIEMQFGKDMQTQTQSEKTTNGNQESTEFDEDEWQL